MTLRIVFLLAICILIVSGCIPSLHPLYKAEDVAFEPALVGTWAEAEDDETWTFEPLGDHAYRLEYTDSDGRPGVFEVHMVELEGERFLDLYPMNPDDGSNEFYAMHLIPAHSFLHVRQMEPTLQMAALNVKRLEDMLENEPLLLAHEEVDGTLVFTASTSDLQAFLPLCVKDPEAFDDYSDLFRRAAESE